MISGLRTYDKRFLDERLNKKALQREKENLGTLPPRKRGSYRKRAKPSKKAMQGAPEPIRDGNEGRWVSDSSITQIGRRKHSSPSPYSLASKKWTWLHARTLIFHCAGKKRGVAGRNPDARKKLVKTVRNNRGNPRHSPRLLCERKYATGRSERHRRNKGK